MEQHKKQSDANNFVASGAGTDERVHLSWTKNLIIVLYGLAGLLLTWSIFAFLYQYIAVLGSFQAVLSAFGDDRLLMALWLSLTSAVVTACLSIVLGVPLAYFFAMQEFRGKVVVETLAVPSSLRQLSHARSGCSTRWSSPTSLQMPASFLPQLRQVSKLR